MSNANAALAQAQSGAVQRYGFTLGCALLGLFLFTGCQSGGQTSDDKAAPVYEEGQSLTMEGTLIDTRCYPLNKDVNRGLDHERPEGFVKACATACANQGFPVAILRGGETDGEVWVLMTVPAVLADYMAEEIRVQGTVRSTGVLIPERVETFSDGEWLTVL
ncbi:MAG: hypothetical protein COV99_12575 [Bacteroidetes bacterium CG12_big_fil_rev_8_21_14_0_65_60_17]|nr:MAG: hypothetical protein COV99_12575 [Bacteroidetes bacterium CG12_big_fil_rev_8_21_14_0_65_60_17]